jgi:hypothetical protein
MVFNATFNNISVISWWSVYWWRKLSFSPNICSFCSLGVGGQVDFIRGAALSLDGEGVPIIACPSTAVMGDKITHLTISEIRSHNDDRQWTKPRFVEKILLIVANQNRIVSSNLLPWGEKADGEGVPIIACPSTAVMGDKITSRIIVPSLKPGRNSQFS